MSLIEFPNNPENIPEKIRKGEEMTFEDLVKVEDRLRRQLEFVFGSTNQEDASASGSIVVPGNTETTVTIEPGDNRNFYLSEVGVNPDNSNINWSIKADDIGTDSNQLFFDNPFTVRDKVKIVIENTQSSEVELDYYTNARSVEVR